MNDLDDDNDGILDIHDEDDDGDGIKDVEVKKTPFVAILNVLTVHSGLRLVRP